MARTRDQIRADLAARFQEAGDRLERVPDGAVDAYCATLANLLDAQERIEREGETLIVADAKGAPVPHPAADVVIRCSRELREYATLLAPRARRR